VAFLRLKPASTVKDRGVCRVLPQILLSATGLIGLRALPLTPVVHLSAVDKDDFSRPPLVATHNLHQSELFTDAALIDLIGHSQVSFIPLCRTVRQRTDAGARKVIS
jgi:hypothetical protein